MLQGLLITLCSSMIYMFGHFLCQFEGLGRFSAIHVNSIPVNVNYIQPFQLSSPCHPQVLNSSFRFLAAGVSWQRAQVCIFLFLIHISITFKVFSPCLAGTHIPSSILSACLTDLHARASSPRYPRSG